MRQVLKRLERTLRHSTLFVLGLFFGRRTSELAAPARIKRILLIRSDRIGDAVLSTPVIQILQQHMPHVVIDLVLGPKNGSVSDLMPFVKNVFVLNRGPLHFLSLIGRLRRFRYDVAIDMLLNDSLTAAVLTIGSGASIRIGYQGSLSALYDRVLERPVKQEHHVVTLLRLIAPFNIGVEAGSARLSINVPTLAIKTAQKMMSQVDKRCGPLVMVNISGSSPSKFWGVEPYSRVISELNAAGIGVMLMCSPRDRDLVTRIASNTASQVAPDSDLTVVAALLSLADLVVTPDTSIVHIAAALGKPVVDLVPAPHIGLQWGPWAVPHRVVTGVSSLRDINETEVLAAIYSLLTVVSPSIKREADSRIVQLGLRTEPHAAMDPPNENGGPA